MASALLEVDGLTKTFGQQRALDAVTLNIEPGEIHALVGENGSGKSTLIKVLAGYHTPDDGRVRVAGQALDLGSPAESSRLGMRFVHQNLGLVDELDAVDNMGLAAGFATGALWTVDRRRQESRARRLLARIAVEADLAMPVGRLRPVERSAIAIARALDSEEAQIRLLVLDEPTAALPPAEVDALFGVIREVAAQGVSVLYVSHRLDEILSLADRVSVLRDGAYEGTFDAATLSRDDVVRHILGHAPADSDSARPVPETVDRSAVAGGPGLRVSDLRTPFLRGLSFEVAAGEILGFAGLDGSGRDDLASALGGAVPATGTVVNREGRSLRKLSPRALRRHGVALVLPNWHAASAVHEFDLRENISLASLASSSRFGVVHRKAESAQALHWLRKVDVRPARPDKPYGELSGGNKQKVIVARWLATRPSALVLDDPTSGVDVGARRQIYDLVRAQAAAGLSVVVCSSDLEDLVELCDRVVCLVDGAAGDELAGSDIDEVGLLRSITASSTSIVNGRGRP